jgi:hypothetical protein
LGCLAGAYSLLDLLGNLSDKCQNFLRWSIQDATQLNHRVSSWGWMATILNFAYVREVQASALGKFPLTETSSSPFLSQHFPK